MSEESVTSDAPIIDLLRKGGPMTVAQLAEAMEVTATAIRQRLSRLLAQELVERRVVKAGRGRPSHRYRLTEKGNRLAGANFDDLALALWREICAIEAPEVRRGLIERVSARLVELYADHVDGETVGQRVQQLAQLFQQRRIPLAVQQDGPSLVLKALACPYPGLADHQRNICALDRHTMAGLLGTPVQQQACRLDGDSCCVFRPVMNGQAVHRTVSDATV